MEWTRDDFTLTDDRARVDLATVVRLLRDSYWARERPESVIARSLDGAVCFSLFHESKQVGFARVISDYATFAWIADVIIDRNFRGDGLGVWMMRCVLSHPSVTQCTRHLLRTQDAHTLYEKFGFQRTDCMMRLVPPVE